MHAVTQAAAHHVRSAQAPAFIEAETFRMAGHSTSDDPTRYRNAADLDRWEARDPLLRMRTLMERLAVPATFFQDLDDELEKFAVEVRAACRAIEDSDLDETFRYTYAEPHPSLDQERADRQRYIETMARD
jgi:pyruvate dehydrogenase E1 component alpha subunit